MLIPLIQVTIEGKEGPLNQQLNESLSENHLTGINFSIVGSHKFEKLVFLSN